MPKYVKQHDAKFNKNDEFYTMYDTIENEISYYSEQFRDKVVYCNCDDPIESNFTKYFTNNFIRLGLKKLISTSYNPNENGRGTLYIYDGNIPYVEQLKSNGDFSKPDCLELLKGSDIVVTNPPFSKFREFIQTLIDYDKDFIVLGKTEAIGYKDIFNLIVENNIRLGSSITKGDITFQVPDKYPLNTKLGFILDGKKYIKVTGIRWWTSMHHGNVNYFLEMDSLEENKEHGYVYRKYHNYDALEVKYVKFIPYDYDGLMGVPLTFLDKFNPDQFEIIGLTSGKLGQSIGVEPMTLEHKQHLKYLGKTFSNGDVYVVDENSNITTLYKRIIIRHKLQYDKYGNPMI